MTDKKEIEHLKAIAETGNITEAAAKLQEKLESLDDTPLDIAITGESGSGKSSFVNAILGLRDDDEGAAATGVTETTIEPKAYSHPTLPNVKIWDLPGIGTPDFQADNYLKQVNFNSYDFFIIIASQRFISHHASLAREIHKMGKKFYYVRSKVDNDLKAEERKRNFNKERTLYMIRENCKENLKALGEAPRWVFLISSWELADYDFQFLQETLENELDAQKRHVFILAMPNISAKIVEKKKAELQELIWEAALVSCVMGALPIPGLSLVCDVVILMSRMKHFCKYLGLDEESLSKLASQVDKPVEELKSVIQKSPLASTVTKDFVMTLLSRSTAGGLMAVELLLDFVPVLGSLAGGALSLGTTRYMLKSFLDDAAEDAKKVLTKFLELKAEKVAQQ
uniref:Interferon-inducible GTPase 5-like n=1 Tax=Pelodiscus sinensis TaxID=13735 RepID=K7EW41_PELSI|nr:interferon-inducible GTPase 5-like [Pelodiscus sinensis]XP_006112705.1 interferon-inducible GTPase 5-like [Pelodiscus sinensis]XP_025046754.1 interferon-inducible GTPase 5-like [Pelodiscus sinensis]XP_025046757.1 interferon-inducible GTPase 5-like [Pelodiscus sinensis]|eukprot:XP_006112704.1 interferon-inducible GTPase 5-like [Pelodiscus sinensis]